MVNDEQARRMQALNALTVWKNGTLMSADEATVSVWDHGFLYGDGVFEGLRLRSGRLYRAYDHFDRLRRSARMLGLTVVYSDDELIAGIGSLAHAEDLDEAHVRVLITRGVGLPGLDPRNCDSPTTLILAYPLPPTLGDKPIKLMVSSVTRKAPRSADPAAKTLNYLDPILGKLQAIAAGADDAVLLDNEGFIAEATASNIFLVRQAVLTTPECTAALPGITRRTILALASELGIPTEVRKVTQGELYAADEAFLTGTGAGVVPMQEIDGRLLPPAPGEVTRRLDTAYRSTWTDPLYTITLE